MMKYFKAFVKSHKNSLLLIFLIITSSKNLQAQESYSIIVDQYYSMSVGAQDLISIRRLTYSPENTLLPLRLFDESSALGKTTDVSYRLARTVLIDLPFDWFVDLVQHEVFGHGSRMREDEFQEIKYQLSSPPPYGNGRGMTWGNYPMYYSIDEDIAMIIGGVEASSILSQQLVQSYVNSGKINSTDALLYIIISNDLTHYLWKTQLESSHLEGNDVIDYESDINEREGYYDNHKLTVADLARQNNILKLLDPFQYFAFFTFLKTYLWDGEKTYDIPMIHLGNMRYLPMFRFGLTPFGSEVYLENYFVQSERNIELYLRYGIPTFHKSWGLGCSGMNLLQIDKVTIGSSIDLWNQPSLESYTKSNALVRSGTGGSISISANVKLIETFASIHLITEIKTKTAGYLQGEPLADAFLWRAGLQFITQ